MISLVIYSLFIHDLIMIWSSYSIKQKELYLRKYDTIKLDDEISLNFPELFIIGRCIKIRFKNRASPCYFLSSRGQKINNITKMEHTRLFLFTLLVSFLMASLAQRLIYTINIWFNFVPGSFFWTRSSIKLNYFRVLCKKMT